MPIDVVSRVDESFENMDLSSARDSAKTDASTAVFSGCDNEDDVVKDAFDAVVQKNMTSVESNLHSLVIASSCDITSSPTRDMSPASAATLGAAALSLEAVCAKGTELDSNDESHGGQTVAGNEITALFENLRAHIEKIPTLEAKTVAPDLEHFSPGGLKLEPKEGINGVTPVGSEISQLYDNLKAHIENIPALEARDSGFARDITTAETLVENISDDTFRMSAESGTGIAAELERVTVANAEPIADQTGWQGAGFDKNMGAEMKLPGWVPGAIGGAGAIGTILGVVQFVRDKLAGTAVAPLALVGTTLSAGSLVATAAVTVGENYANAIEKELDGAGESGGNCMEEPPPLPQGVHLTAGPTLPDGAPSYYDQHGYRWSQGHKGGWYRLDPTDNQYQYWDAKSGQWIKCGN